MTPDELRAIMAYLREKVQLDSSDTGNPSQISFSIPTHDEMIQAGLNPKGVQHIVAAPWWEDMVTDIIETPDFCERQ